MGKTAERNFSELLRLARDFGAEEAKIITADQIVVEDRIVLKCKYGCHMYGRKLICSPFVPTPEEFRHILKEYRHALLMKFNSAAEADDDVARSLLKNRFSPDTPKELRERTMKFWSEWDKDKTRVLLAILELEKAAFNSGYTLALGLAAGSCVLCEKCNVDGPCTHPTMARLPEHAVGVNVRKTLKNAGMALSFPFKKRPHLVGMVLID